jgi:hypothetical protein
MQNFKEILDNIDVNPLLKQLSEHQELWDTNSAWTRDKDASSVTKTIENITLRMNQSPDWNKPAFNVLNAAIPITFDLMRAVPGELLGKVVILRLKPGAVVKPHRDTMPAGCERVYERYQVPLQCDPTVKFNCGEDSEYLPPGKAFWFESRNVHSMINTSNTDRISILIDIKPFVPHGSIQTAPKHGFGFGFGFAS